VNNSPAFLLYPADLLSDEHVVLMTNQELGCYIKLLCYCWREGSIPDDISKIARLCGEPTEVMAQLWLAISSCFTEHENEPNRLTNPRLKSERKKQEEHRKERSESGKKGANSRWNKSNGSAITQPIAEPMANDGFSFSFSNKNNNAQFDSFYSSYPLKRGKKAALKQWLKNPTLSNGLFDTIMAALEGQKAHKAHLKAQNQFCPEWPYPAKWLKDERWNDEIEKPREGKGWI
jgi:uncharacterized protein YdaU (DUF1376 family)